MKHIKLYEELSEWTKELLGLRNYYRIQLEPPTLDKRRIFSNSVDGIIINYVIKELRNKGILFDVIIKSGMGFNIQVLDLNLKNIDIIKKFTMRETHPSGTEETWKLRINKLSYYDQDTGEFDYIPGAYNKSFYLNCSIRENGSMTIYRYIKKRGIQDQDQPI